MFLLLLLLCCKSFPYARIFATPAPSPPSPLYYVILYYTLYPFSYVILSDLYLSPKTVTKPANRGGEEAKDPRLELELATIIGQT